MKLQKKVTKKIQKSLIKWISSNHRDFVWRTEEPDPYLILVSEMMLRKTQAESAEKVIKEILLKYPNISALARADIKDLEMTVKPIGLFRIRSKALLDVATIISSKYKGRIPNNYEELIELPHIGRYSSNAILCFAFNQPRAIVDANVVRVFSRAFRTEIPVEVHKADELWSFSQSLVPTTQFKEYNKALLDLGAIVCKPQNPRCSDCPINNFCNYYATHHQSNEVDGQ